MCNVNGKASFSKKNIFTNTLKMGLTLWAWVKNKQTQKIVLEVEIHRLPGKENVLGAAVSKNVMLTVFYNMKELMRIDFHKKDATVNCTSCCKFRRQNSHNLLNDSQMY